jgi:ATP-dependent DNA helicase RecG
VPESERTILTLHVKSNLLEEVQQMEEIVETEEHELFLFPEEEPVNEDFADQESSVNNKKSSMNNSENSVNKGSNSVNNDGDIIKRDNNSVNNGDVSVNKESNSYNSDNNSDIKENNSYNNEEKPFVSAFNSDNSEMHATNEQEIDRVTSDLKVEQKEEKADFASSKEIEEELWGISEIARKKRRLKPSVMEEVIVRLCAKKPLMLKELARLLERTPDGLRNNYLAKLLNKGKIRLKYPDQLNHPKQAYIIVEERGK